MSRMGNKCKSLFERGRFFIETGTVKHFNVFHKNNNNAVKYIPDFILKRIEDLIKTGEKDKAVTLWMKACECADKAPIQITKDALSILFHLSVTGIAIYAFLKVIFL